MNAQLQPLPPKNFQESYAILKKLALANRR